MSTHRLLIVMSYMTQTLCVITAALCLWLAIEFFLTGHPYLSVWNTVVSFHLSKPFFDCTRDRQRLKKPDAKASG